MFKKGDRVRCVDNEFVPNVLEVGRVYEVVRCYDYCGEMHLEVVGVQGGWYLQRFELVAPAVMSLDEYQKQALRSADMGLSHRDLLLKNALGIGGESGEIVDHVKKHVFHGHPLDKDKVKKELGDLLWYIAAKADSLEMTLSEVGQANIEKLLKRYPNGFSVEASLNRSE